MLAVVLSHGVYRDRIHSGLSAAEPAWFRRVRVVEKEMDDDAWLWLPGRDAHSLALPEQLMGEDDRSDATCSADLRRSVATAFLGPVNFGGGTSVIGIHNDRSR